PRGTRTWLVSHTTGAMKDTDGTTNTIPFYDAVNLGSFSFPYLTVLAALNDPLAAASFVRTVQTSDGRQANLVHLEWPFSPTDDPAGLFASLRATDFLVDAQSSLLISVSQKMYAIDNLAQSFTHEVEFGNYTVVNGVAVPMLVR